MLRKLYSGQLISSAEDLDFLQQYVRAGLNVHQL
mgnify:CR=1 FL=1